MKKQRLLDRLLTAVDQQRIMDKIKEIENRSSGEVRVHITDQKVRDALIAARKTFVALGMTATRQRNGVLVFFSLSSRSFAIVGDEGIDAFTGSDYWSTLSRDLGQQFTAGSYVDGLLQVLNRVEEVLVQHFPWEEGDVDELPDEISYTAARPSPLPWIIIAAVLASAGLVYLAWRLFFSGWT